MSKLEIIVRPLYNFEDAESVLKFEFFVFSETNYLFKIKVFGGSFADKFVFVSKATTTKNILSSVRYWKALF